MRKMLNEKELKLKRAMKSIDIVPRELRFLISISVKNMIYIIIIVILKVYIFIIKFHPTQKTPNNAF